MRDPKERLKDILEAIDAIERHIDNRSDFENNEILQVWAVHHLQIIGESARALPEHVRSRAPDIPWSKIIGMRNILVHSYFDIDIDIVWNVVQRDLPELKPKIEALLKRL